MGGSSPFGDTASPGKSAIRVRSAGTCAARRTGTTCRPNVFGKVLNLLDANKESPVSDWRGSGGRSRYANEGESYQRNLCLTFVGCLSSPSGKRTLGDAEVFRGGSKICETVHEVNSRTLLPSSQPMVIERGGS